MSKSFSKSNIRRHIIYTATFELRYILVKIVCSMSLGENGAIESLDSSEETAIPLNSAEGVFDFGSSRHQILKAGADSLSVLLYHTIDESASYAISELIRQILGLLQETSAAESAFDASCQYLQYTTDV